MAKLSSFPLIALLAELHGCVENRASIVRSVSAASACPSVGALCASPRLSGSRSLLPHTMPIVSISSHVLFFFFLFFSSSPSSRHVGADTRPSDLECLFASSCTRRGTGLNGKCLYCTAVCRLVTALTALSQRSGKGLAALHS